MAEGNKVLNMSKYNLEKYTSERFIKSRISVEDIVFINNWGPE